MPCAMSSGIALQSIIRYAGSKIPRKFIDVSSDEEHSERLGLARSKKEYELRYRQDEAAAENRALYKSSDWT